MTTRKGKQAKITRQLAAAKRLATSLEPHDTTGRKTLSDTLAKLRGAGIDVKRDAVLGRFVGMT